MIRNMPNVGESGLLMKTIEKLIHTNLRLNDVEIENVKHLNKTQTHRSTLLVTSSEITNRTENPWSVIQKLY